MGDVSLLVYLVDINGTQIFEEEERYVDLLINIVPKELRNLRRGEDAIMDLAGSGTQ